MRKAFIRKSDVVQRPSGQILRIDLTDTNGNVISPVIAAGMTDGAVVANLLATRTSVGSLTWAILDNVHFRISGSQLLRNVPAGPLTQGVAEVITIRATDPSGSFSDVFVIQLNTVPEKISLGTAPQAFGQNSSIVESDPQNTQCGTFIVRSTGSYPKLPYIFTIQNGNTKFAIGQDASGLASLVRSGTGTVVHDVNETVVVRVTDGNGVTYDETITVSILSVPVTDGLTRFDMLPRPTERIFLAWNRPDLGDPTAPVINTTPPNLQSGQGQTGTWCKEGQAPDTWKAYSTDYPAINNQTFDTIENMRRFAVAHGILKYGIKLCMPGNLGYMGPYACQINSISQIQNQTEVEYIGFVSLGLQDMGTGPTGVKLWGEPNLQLKHFSGGSGAMNNQLFEIWTAGHCDSRYFADDLRWGPFREDVAAFKTIPFNSQGATSLADITYPRRPQQGFGMALAERFRQLSFVHCEGFGSYASGMHSTSTQTAARRSAVLQLKDCRMAAHGQDNNDHGTYIGQLRHAVFLRNYWVAPTGHCLKSDNEQRIEVCGNTFAGYDKDHKYYERTASPKVFKGENTFYEAALRQIPPGKTISIYSWVSDIDVGGTGLSMAPYFDVTSDPGKTPITLVGGPPGPGQTTRTVVGNVTTNSKNNNGVATFAFNDADIGKWVRIPGYGFAALRKYQDGVCLSLDNPNQDLAAWGNMFHNFPNGGGQVIYIQGRHQGGDTTHYKHPAYSVQAPTFPEYRKMESVQGGVGPYPSDGEQGALPPKSFFGWVENIPASFTASISATTMTVTGTVTGGPLDNGMVVQGAGVTASTEIVKQLTPLLPGEKTGGAGRYQLTQSQTVASEAMTTAASGYGLQWVDYAYVEMTCRSDTTDSPHPAFENDGKTYDIQLRCDDGYIHETTFTFGSRMDGSASSQYDYIINLTTPIPAGHPFTGNSVDRRNAVVFKLSAASGGNAAWDRPRMDSALQRDWFDPNAPHYWFRDVLVDYDAHTTAGHQLDFNKIEPDGVNRIHGIPFTEIFDNYAVPQMGTDPLNDAQASAPCAVNSLNVTFSTPPSRYSGAPNYGLRNAWGPLNASDGVSWAYDPTYGDFDWQLHPKNIYKGSPTLDNSAGHGTITRSSGSFLADGFFNGQLVHVWDARSDINGNYTISNVTATVITMTTAFPTTGGALPITPGAMTLSEGLFLTGGPLYAREATNKMGFRGTDMIRPNAIVIHDFPINDFHMSSNTKFVALVRVGDLSAVDGVYQSVAMLPDMRVIPQDGTTTVDVNGVVPITTAYKNSFAPFMDPGQPFDCIAPYGTSSGSYCIHVGDTNLDRCRIRVKTLAVTNPFKTTNLQNTVTVTLNNHRLIPGRKVRVLTAGGTVGGLTMTGDWIVVSIPTINTFTFTHTSPATSTVAAGGGSCTLAVIPLSTDAIALETDNKWALTGGGSHRAKISSLTQIDPVTFDMVWNIPLPYVGGPDPLLPGRTIALGDEMGLSIANPANPNGWGGRGAFFAPARTPFPGWRKHPTEIPDGL
jgi:hypothetical protein